MKNNKPFRPVALAIGLSLLLGAAVAQAQWLSPSSAYVAVGSTPAGGAYDLTAGVTWPLPWRHMGRTGEWSTYAEGFVSYWDPRSDGERHGVVQIGLVPVLRYRFGEGRSNWFAEAGIGLSYMNRLYQRDDKRFSTRFNFYDTLGVGRSFGAQREHEISVRFSHISNAGIKHPNPGENFVQLRYAHSF